VKLCRPNLTRLQPQSLFHTERTHLETIVRKATAPQRDAFRAKIVLLAAAGYNNIDTGGNSPVRARRPGNGATATESYVKSKRFYDVTERLNRIGLPFYEDVKTNP
jgi:hypothetical protein